MNVDEGRNISNSITGEIILGLITSEVELKPNLDITIVLLHTTE